MIEFALGYLCGAIMVAIVWWMQTTGEKSHQVRPLFFQRPDNTKARRYATPKYVREIEEHIYKGALPDEYENI